MVNFAELVDSIDATTGNAQEAPVKAKSGIDFAGLVDQVSQSETNSRMQAATVSGIVSEFNPDEIAKARNLGRQVGIPDAVAERNPGAVRRKFISQKVEQLFDRAPVAGRKMGDPDFAKLTHDITDELAGQEEALKQLALTKQGFRAASELSMSMESQKRSEALDRVFGIERTRSVGDVALDTGRSFVAAAGPRLAQSSYGVAAAGAEFLSPLADWAVGTILPANPLRVAGEGLLGLAETQGKIAEGIVGNRADQGYFERAAQQGVESMALSLEALIAGLVTRNPNVALNIMATITGGSEYVEARAQGVPVNTALVYATSQGVIEKATEMLPVDTLFKGLRDGKGLLNNLVVANVQEQFGEQIATVLQDLNQWAILNPEKPFSEYIAERPEAALQTAIATIVGTTGQVTILQTVESLGKFMADERGKFEYDNAHAQQVMQNFANLQKLTEQATLKQRSSQDFQTFMQEAGGEAGVSEVYVDANVLMQEAQNLGVDLNSLMQSSPAIAEQIEAALQMNDDLVIPVGEFSTSIAGTELGAALLKHLRADENGLSAFEAETQLNEAVENLEKTAADFMQKEANDENWRTELTSIADEVKAELVAAGRTGRYSDAVVDGLVVPFYDTLARELKISPAELRKLRKFEVRSTIGERGLDQFNSQTESPQFKAWFGDSKVVDSDGNPLVVYHGTVGDITTFDPERAGQEKKSDWGKGVYFTPRPSNADYYRSEAAKRQDAESDRLWSMLEAEEKKTTWSNGTPTYTEKHGELMREWREARQNAENQAGSVFPVYLSIKNPLIQQYTNMPDPFLADKAKEGGHDGIVVMTPNGKIDEIIAFSPTQIKSATGNNGQFDANDPNILRQTDITPTQEAMQKWKESVSRVNSGKLDYIPRMITPTALRSIGVEDGWIDFPTRYIMQINKDHPDVPVAVYENLPALLSDPILAMPGKEGGIDIVIEAKSSNGAPLIVGVRDGRIRTITPIDPYGDESSEQRIAKRLEIGIRAQGAKVYARNEKAITDAMAFSTTKEPSGLFPLRRDPSGRNATIVTRDQLVKKYGNELYQEETYKELIAQHNLSAENLLHADRMGGIPVPSLAVTKKDAPITGFGEITLLASPEMIDPKGYAKPKVFGSDIYSPRYPQISYKLGKDALVELNKLLEPYRDEGRQIYGSQIDSVDDLIQIDAFKKYATEKLGENAAWSQTKAAAADLLRQAGAKEQIFQGFTYSGNRKYIDHTIENVVKLLKKELRGGETFNYGLGSVRSKFTPQFKSIADIRKNKNRLMDKTSFEAAKEEMEQELFAISDMLAPYHGYSGNFGYLDTVTGTLSDAATMGIPRALSENGFKEVPAEAMEPVRQFLEKLRGMPTEYFEAKILRDVDLAEFSGAVVPEGVDQSVISALNERGVNDIRYYKDGDETSRKAAIAQFENLFFQKSQNSPRGQIAFGDDIKDGAIISLLKNADASTFIHELGHFFLEVYADVAAEQNAPAKVVADMDNLLKWMGIEPTPEVSLLDTWRQMTLEQKRPYHEKLARAFEQYAMEGKAPTLELSRTFAQLKSFMLSAYESLKKFFDRSGDPGLSKEVRQVFDRMLASNAAIEQAQSIRGMFPLFASAEEAGMTPDEYAEYVQGDADATNEARQQLDARSLRDLKWLRGARARFLRALQKEARDARREARMEVRREVMSQPVYQAWAWLKQLPEPKDSIAKKRKSETVDPEVDSLFAAIAKLGGLKRSVMQSEFGVEPKERVESGIFGKPVLRKEGGMHPDLMAESLAQYGYLATDENGKADVQEFEERFFEELRGNKQYSIAGEGVMMREWQDRMYDGEEKPDFDAIGRGKFDLAMMQALYGQEGDWQKLGIGRTGMVMADGYDPGHIAGFFGFSSGDQLVQALMAAENPSDLIERMVDERMLEQYGELSTEAAMQEAADKAVHNEMRAKVLATELAAQNKALGNRRLVEAAAREYADRMLANTKIRDIKASKFTRAESKAAKTAESAMKKGDTNTVVQAKRDQLLNNRAAKASLDALDEVETTLKYLKKFDSEGVRKNLDIEYIEQIDDILARFDLRKGASLNAIDKRQSLTEWVAEQEAQGLEPVIDEQLLNEARRESYKNLTLEQFRAVADSVRNIEHLGRLKKKLLTAKDQREFAARIDEAKRSIADNANRTVEERATPNDAVGKFTQWVRRMGAAHRKFSSLMRELDGGKDMGVMADLLLYPMFEAGSNETDMRQKAAEEVAKLFEPILGDMQRSAGNLYAVKRVVPGTNISMTHEQRIMFGMNWGNEGNRQRLLDGGIAGARKLTMQDAQAILDTLTQKEWNFIQSILDYVGSYRNQIAAQEKELTGREPKWVDPAPIETRFGTYAGGYFPLKYDALLSTRSESLEAVTDLRMAMKGAFNTAATRNGYTQQRAQAVMNRPVLLSFDAISRHVHEVTHRLAWQNWLTDANRVIKALDSDIREHLGPESLQEMRQHINDVALGDAPITGTTDVILSRIRTGTSIIGMGWRVTTALLQPSGIFMTWARLGLASTTNGILKTVSDPVKTHQWVMENSAMMRNRAKTLNREINEIMNTVRAGKKLTTLQASYFFMITKMQMMIDIPTYVAAYEKALADKGYESAASEEQRSAIEQAAHSFAGQTVIDTQVGGEIKDLAGIQKGSQGQKLFTNFYSWFSALYNLNVENYRTKKLTDPIQFADFVATAILLNVMPAIYSVLLKELLKGDCGWDDTECLLQRYKTEQMGTIFGQVIGLRDIGVAIDVATGGDAFGYSGPPSLRFFADVYKTGQQIEQGEADLALFKSANSAAGILFHYPAGQINTTIDGISAIDNGDVEGVSAATALIAGKPRP